MRIVPQLGPQFDDRRLFGRLIFQNGLEYRNFDFSVLIGNQVCTLFRKFVKIHFSDSRVSDVRICTAGIDNFTTLSSAMFAWGKGVRHCGDQ